MSRIPGADPGEVDPSIRAILDAQAERWGTPLPNHLLYARRPSLFRGVRAMWDGIGESGLIDGQLQVLINRRVAALNGCLF